LWTGPDVARWVAEKTGREQVAPQRGHDYLRRVGMSPRRPRPRHQNADPAEQAAFTKKLGDEVAAIRTVYPAAEVQLWGRLF